MRILALADLHRQEADQAAIAEQDAWVCRLLEETSPEVVVIVGDIFESGNCQDRQFNPYRILSRLFGNIPVICTLGNHEFFHRSVAEVMDFYRECYEPQSFNVHYLDVVGFRDIGLCRFLGNVFWYDGSLRTVANQDMGNFANHTWTDYTIRNFDWLAEHERCKREIIRSRATDRINVLCTHTVPHIKLNHHIAEKAFRRNQDECNAYSGVIDFLDRHRFNYSFCGHTHGPIAAEINGCRCFNIGNDYYPPFRHCAVELERPLIDPAT